MGCTAVDAFARFVSVFDSSILYPPTDTAPATRATENNFIVYFIDL